MSCRFFCIFQMNNEINLGFVGQDMAPGKKKWKYETQQKFLKIESHENEFLQKTSWFYKLQCTVCVHYRVLHSTYWTVYSKLLVPWTSVIALFATNNTSWRHLLAPLQSLQYTLHYIKFKCISHPKCIWRICVSFNQLSSF